MRKQIFFRNTINFCLSQLVIIIEKITARFHPLFLTFLIRHVCYFLWKDKIWYESMIPTNVGWKKKARPKMCFDKSVPLDFPIGMQQECSLLKKNHKVRVYMRETHPDKPLFLFYPVIFKKYSCTNLSLLLEASSLYNNSIHEKSTISSNLSLYISIDQLTRFGWNQDQNIAFPPQTFFSIQQGIWYSFAAAAAYNNVVKNSSKLLIRNFCT